ncbi:hypothetical protein CBM2618_A210020 [Cupriavidus taiwanensis]|nr:hypothetical protein CBM2591_A250022 [Cupriavidus taiwanensis]SOZ79214.1 hypothetical protein CBM2618_A210020 [Cupriavidus taiwanensis]
MLADILVRGRPHRCTLLRVIH